VDPRQRLESWKEIAAYLDRSERTVRRWEEKEGLPIRRLQHDKRSSVYAYTGELHAWRESRQQLLEAEPAADPTPSRLPIGYQLRPWLAGAVVALAVVVSAGAFWRLDRPAATSAHTPNPEAVRLVRRAFFGGNAGRVQIQTAIRLYEDAIRIDPMFSGAWSGLGTAHIAMTWFGETPASETMALAKREAREALRLDPSNSSGWRVLGFASHYLDWDHSAAEAHLRKAIDLTPTNAVMLSWFGDFLTDMRRFDEARAYYRRAQDASPRWLEPITFFANTYTFTGNPDLAIVEQRRVLESEPNFGLGIHFLGRSYLAKGEYAHAIELLRKSNEVMGRVPFSVGDLGYALALSGQRDEAQSILDELMAKRSHGYYPAFPIAQIHLGLAEIDGALEWLDRAADERHLGFFLPSADPIYDPLRSHPRFKALMQRINIEMPTR
jgi:Tfp pilus assembly protein PilF